MEASNLTFAFPGYPPFLRDFHLALPEGSCCLLLGANGAGKSTLLQVLAGKYMVPEESVRILGRPPFHDLDLTSHGTLSYLGSAWRKEASTAGNDVALQVDISAEEMIFGVQNIDPTRRDELIHLLDIDLAWRINKVSDGQRRRVQICLGLLKPYKVLLLDEITVDMDVVGRMDLLSFFKKEAAVRGATIIYATHIFDGLEEWISHVAYVAHGKVKRVGDAATVMGMLATDGDEGVPTLFDRVEAWLQEDHVEGFPEEEGAGAGARASMPSGFGNRHMAYYR